MKHFVMLNAYGQKNIGDEAIQSSAFALIQDLLQKVGEKATITVLCESPENFPKYSLDTLTIQPQLMPYGYALRNVWPIASELSKIIAFIVIICSSLFLSLVGLFWSSFLPRKGFYSYIYAIYKAEKVFGIGGGYLLSKSAVKDIFGLGLTLLPIYIAKLFRKKILHLPISVGPFASELHGFLTYWALTNTSVFCREEISFNLLNKYDNDKNLITSQIYPDLALFLPNLSYQKSKKHNIWTLTAREWLPESQQNKYETALAYLVDKMWEVHKIKSQFLVMVHNEVEDDDERVYRRIRSKLLAPEALIVLYPKNHLDAQRALQRSSFAVCTRMHSAILSHTVEKPFITIGYGHKGLGFMKSIGMEKWYLDIENVNEKNILKTTFAFIKNENIQKIKNEIKKQRKYFKIERNKLLEDMTKFI